MLHSYARQYLMRSLAIRRKNVAKLEERVKAGRCIMDGCTEKCVSRGLCDKHRQRFYLEMRKLGSDEDRVQFEENCIREGLILPNGEQEKWTKANPFAKAMVS
jgi:hypothetical protein